MSDSSGDASESEEDSSSEDGKGSESSGFAASANKSSSSDESVGSSSLDEGSSIQASEPEKSDTDSADLQEESDMERGTKGRGRSNVRPGGRGRSTAPRRNTHVGGGSDTLVVGRS